jgi:hypothetical protein
MPQEDSPENQAVDRGLALTRRQLLGRMGAGGALLAVAPALSRFQAPSLSSSSTSQRPHQLSPRGLARRADEARPLHVVWTNVALPPNIDPAIGFDSDTLQVVRNVYEGLLEYAPGSTALRPALAERYSVSPDGLTYTFELRKGVVFHDGTPFDSAAAVMSLNRIREINQGPASLLVNVKGFRTAGPSSVVVELSAPYVFLPGVMPWLPIVSPTAMKAHATASDRWAEKWFASNAVGTGPYMLSAFNPTTHIDLVSNPHYWQPWHNGTPTSASLTLNPNVTTQLELLQAGQVDFLGAISPDNAATAKSLSNVVLLVQPGLEVQILPLNMERPPMNDPRVRLAMVQQGLRPSRQLTLTAGAAGLGLEPAGPKAGSCRGSPPPRRRRRTEGDRTAVRGRRGPRLRDLRWDDPPVSSIQAWAQTERPDAALAGARDAHVARQERAAHSIPQPVGQHRRPERHSSRVLGLLADRQQGWVQLVLLPERGV